MHFSAEVVHRGPGLAILCERQTSWRITELWTRSWLRRTGLTVSCLHRCRKLPSQHYFPALPLTENHAYPTVTHHQQSRIPNSHAKIHSTYRHSRPNENCWNLKFIFQTPTRGLSANVVRYSFVVMNTNILKKELDDTYVRSAPDISLLTLRWEREAHRPSTAPYAGKGHSQGRSKFCETVPPRPMEPQCR